MVYSVKVKIPFLEVFRPTMQLGIDRPPPPPGGTPYSGPYGEAPPERGAFFKLTEY